MEERRRAAYVYGSAAPKVNDARPERVKEVHHQAIRRNRERVNHMNLGMAMILASAVIMVAAMLCSYIELQADVTARAKHITKLESQYNEMKLANDEKYNRINSSIDLDQIRAVAIGELGMTYAKEGQIVKIHDASQDYVYQVADLPEGD